MDRRDLIDRIEHLRESRAPRGPETALGGEFARLQRSIGRTADGVSEASEVWVNLCPPELVEQTRVLSCASGVLKIGVESAAARFQLDRWLRGGGTRQIIAACRTPLRDVRLSLVS